jgi:hypothetical protein
MTGGALLRPRPDLGAGKSMRHDCDAVRHACAPRRGVGRRLCRIVVWCYLAVSCAATVRGVVLLLRECIRRRKRPRHPVRAQTIPDWAFRQPDPLIYSQEWLRSQGLAVTWKNPDVQLYLASNPAVPVDSNTLLPDTKYRIVAQVWNGSLHAPVAQLPVNVSYLDFGIGGVSVPIATTTVDLPVKGAAGTPALAKVDWHTPKTPGHYCIRVRLDWPYDANLKNNMGQHNVDVKPLNSPKATFIVPVRNERRGRLTLRLEVDAYELGKPAPCPPADHEPVPPEERHEPTFAVHGIGRHPLPPGWTVETSDSLDEFVLGPGASRDVTITLVAPSGFKGRQAANVNALAGTVLIGGVTLIAEGDANG